MFSPRSNARYHCSVPSSIETDEERRRRRRRRSREKSQEEKSREKEKKNVIFLMCNIISREGHRDDDPIVSPHRVHALAFAFGRLRSQAQAQARSTWKAFVSSKRNTNRIFFVLFPSSVFLSQCIFFFFFFSGSSAVSLVQVRAHKKMGETETETEQRRDAFLLPSSVFSSFSFLMY